MRRHSLGALLAAGLLAGGLTTSANAADLGGNCCADLEERIAELEATTARKGNRKVSLTISGWVAEQVVYWDDGNESNIYVTGIGRTLQSHFKMTGQATIAPGWTAGYVLHVEVGTVDAFGYSSSSDDTPASLGGFVNDSNNGLYALQSYWFINSDRLGKLSVGKMSQASDNTAILVDGSGSLVPANWLNIDGDNLGGGWVNFLGHCHTINDGIGGDCNGVTENVIRYDSPTFQGFSFSTSWGEDDMWDVAARYAGEFNGVKVAIAAAYSRVTDENLVVVPNGGAIVAPGLTVGDIFRVQSDKDVGYFQIGAFLHHVPTGLFVYGAYGKEHGDVTYSGTSCCDIYADVDGSHWYVKAGLRRKWHELGHTVLYGEYGQMDDMTSPTAAALIGGLPVSSYDVATITGSELTKWGLGIVQEIDAAAMSLWVSYRNYSGELHYQDYGYNYTISPDDIHYVKAGALINF